MPQFTQPASVNCDHSVYMPEPRSPREDTSQGHLYFPPTGQLCDGHLLCAWLGTRSWEPDKEGRLPLFTAFRIQRGRNSAQAIPTTVTYALRKCGEGAMVTNAGAPHANWVSKALWKMTHRTSLIRNSPLAANGDTHYYLQ